MSEENPFEIRNQDVWAELKKFTAKKRKKRKKTSKLCKGFLNATQKGQLKSLYKGENPILIR